jgi:hypothetical protein
VPVFVAMDTEATEGWFTVIAIEDDDPFAHPLFFPATDMEPDDAFERKFTVMLFVVEPDMIFTLAGTVHTYCVAFPIAGTE